MFARKRRRPRLRRFPRTALSEAVRSAANLAMCPNRQEWRSSARLALQMLGREDQHFVAFHAVDYAIGEPLEPTAPRVLAERLPGVGKRRDPPQRRLEKPLSESAAT